MPHLDETLARWQALCDAPSPDQAFAEHFAPFATTDAGRQMLADLSRRVEGLEIDREDEDGPTLEVLFWTGPSEENSEYQARWTCLPPCQQSLAGFAPSHRACLELHNGILHTWARHERLSPVELEGVHDDELAELFLVARPDGAAPSTLSKQAVDSLLEAIDEVHDMGELGDRIQSGEMPGVPLELAWAPVDLEGMRELVSRGLAPYLDEGHYDWDTIDEDHWPAITARGGDRYYLVEAATTVGGEPGLAYLGHDAPALLWPFRLDMQVGDVFLSITGHEIVLASGSDDPSGLYSWFPN